LRGKETTGAIRVSPKISARLHRVVNWDILNEKCYYVNMGPVLNYHRANIENSRKTQNKSP
jgi:hypothetical protein